MESLLLPHSPFAFSRSHSTTNTPILKPLTNTVLQFKIGELDRSSSMRKDSRETTASAEETLSPSQSPLLSPFMEEEVSGVPQDSREGEVLGKHIQNQTVQSNETALANRDLRIGQQDHNYFSQMQTQPPKPSQRLNHRLEAKRNMQPSAHKHNSSTEHSKSPHPLPPSPAFLLRQQNTTESQTARECNQRWPRVPAALPRKGAYSKNRIKLFNWLQKECVDLRLSRQTFGNALFLMDYYFGREVFKSIDFLKAGLCFLIIASKRNESAILFTSTIARNNSIAPQELLSQQLRFLQWFDFRTDPYNFARILSRYVEEWDQLAVQHHVTFRVPRFMEGTLEGFILYQKLFFLSENQLRLHRQLLLPSIRAIFEQLILPFVQDQRLGYEFVSKVLQIENAFRREEARFVYECCDSESPEQQEHLRAVQTSIRQWSHEFEAVRRKELEVRFEELMAKRERFCSFVHWCF